MKNNREMFCPWGHGRPWAGPEDFLNFYRSLRSVGLTEEDIYLVILHRLSPAIGWTFDKNRHFVGIRISTICEFNITNMRYALRLARDSMRLNKGIVKVVIIP